VRAQPPDSYVPLPKRFFIFLAVINDLVFRNQHPASYLYGLFKETMVTYGSFANGMMREYVEREPGSAKCMIQHWGSRDREFLPSVESHDRKADL
jgi:hypothetical protein